MRILQFLTLGLFSRRHEAMLQEPLPQLAQVVQQPVVTTPLKPSPVKSEASQDDPLKDLSKVLRKVSLVRAPDQSEKSMKLPSPRPLKDFQITRAPSRDRSTKRDLSQSMVSIQSHDAVLETGHVVRLPAQKVPIKKT